MPKSCRESRPEDHTTLTFEGAPSLPAARGQHSPGAVPARPLPLLQGGCGRKFQGWSQPTPPFPGSPKPPPLPVYLRCAPHSPGADSALRPVSQARRAASTSANRSSLGASLPRVPLREEARAPVNAPAGRDGGGGQTRAAREDPRRAEAEQTPGGGQAARTGHAHFAPLGPWGGAGTLGN